MVDILYVLGKGFSEWRNNELRYSLRSIAKYGKNVGRVFLVGYIPYWVNRKEVVCLPLKDTTRNKHYNIMTAIEYAIEHSDIGEHFLYSSDDHYYIRETDFDKYPVFWRGVELPTEYAEKRTWYNTTLVSTFECLNAFRLTTHHYAWHGNTHFKRSLWESKRMQMLRLLAKQLPECCDPTCLMLNYWKCTEPDTMPEQIAREDKKVSTAHDIDSLKKIAESREVISSTDAVGDALKMFLTKEFPKPCKYEEN